MSGALPPRQASQDELRRAYNDTSAAGQTFRECLEPLRPSDDKAQVDFFLGTLGAIVFAGNIVSPARHLPVSPAISAASGILLGSSTSEAVNLRSEVRAGASQCYETYKNSPNRAP
jgi:hypothetical protein